MLSPTTTICWSESNSASLHQTQGASNTKEILRCLKRAIAREVFTLITSPPSAADYRELRPKRQELGLLQVHAAVGLGVSTAKISLAERAQVHDAVFLIKYDDWLNSRDLTP